MYSIRQYRMNEELTGWNMSLKIHIPRSSFEYEQIGFVPSDEDMSFIADRLKTGVPIIFDFGIKNRQPMSSTAYLLEEYKPGDDNIAITAVFKDAERYALNSDKYDAEVSFAVAKDNPRITDFYEISIVTGVRPLMPLEATRERILLMSIELRKQAEELYRSNPTNANELNLTNVTNFLHNTAIDLGLNVQDGVCINE